jgi:ribokinase
MREDRSALHPAHCHTASMRAAVVGHTEWVWFGAVDRIPGPGDIAHATDEWELPGGGGAVAAVQLAKLADGCDFYTVFGDDDFAPRSVRGLEAFGVRVHAAIRPDTPTRRALSLVGPDGERTITTLGARLEPRAEDPLPWEQLDESDAVYVTAGDPGAFVHARRAGTMVVTTRVLRDLLASEVEPDALVGSARDPAERVDVGALPFTPPLLVRTEGGRGGTFVSGDGRSGRFAAEPADRAPNADAYGAGDSFAGGLTFALGSAMGVEEALRLAAWCGAGAASGRGPYSRQLSLG